MTKEQAALLCKARDSVRAAKLLADDGLYDFAVSRAYYTMFYVAEAFLLEEGAAFSRHSAVIAAFGERFAKTGRIPAKFHRYLIEGQDRRNVGDYDIGPALDCKQAANEISRAEQFLELADDFLGSTLVDK
ncbi:MAG: HEPN domain-containing protein [Phycisphaerae bacterium]|nr:HEPN domain-containing protein [Phycisphaerae bacterium]